MNKKGGIGWQYVISALLVIIVVVVIAVWGPSVLRSLGSMLGFESISLTPEESAVQNEARVYFLDNVYQKMRDCVNSNNNSCFCNNESLAIPNGYKLVFKEDGNGVKLSLFNHKGGFVVDKWVDSVKLCVGDETDRLIGVNGYMKDSEVDIVAGENYIIQYETLSGDKVIKNLDEAYYMYRAREGFVCILNGDASVLRNHGVCS